MAKMDKLLFDGVFQLLERLDRLGLGRVWLAPGVNGVLSSLLRMYINMSSLFQAFGNKLLRTILISHSTNFELSSAGFMVMML